MRRKLRYPMLTARYVALLVAAMAVVATCTSSDDDDGPVVGSETVRPAPSAPTTTPLTSSRPDSFAGPVGFPTPVQDGLALPPHPEPTPADPAPLASVDGTLSHQGSIDPWSFISNRTCGGGPLFSAFPMDLENVTNINPLGNLAPPGHTFPTSHMYFGIESVPGEVDEGPFGDGQTFPPNPVYAVADSQLVSISVSTVTTSLSGQELSYVEYGFDLAVCEGLRVRYGHVGPVSNRILASIANLPGFNCNAYSTGAFAVDGCTYAPGLDLAAGEQLGFNSGRSAALDIGAYDITRRSNDFLHPELYGEEATGSVCVLDLYPDDQRSAMLQLLGDSNGLRTADPICGVLYYTVPGTLQGNWFNEIRSFTQEDLNIAFVYDEVLPDVPVISIGFVPGIQSAALRFDPQDEGRINRSFVDVEAGAGVFCYQDFRDDFGNPGPDTLLFVEVPEDGRLLVRAEDGAECGGGPWEIGTEATEFVR
ncbi:MAG: hypothetical protein IIC92_10235 [Chloroflexi bacterium]|nr:hypothetical protein [Chloroflexota bacterium]